MYFAFQTPTSDSHLRVLSSTSLPCQGYHHWAANLKPPIGFVMALIVSQHTYSQHLRKCVGGEGNKISLEDVRMKRGWELFKHLGVKALFFYKIDGMK